MWTPDVIRVPHKSVPALIGWGGETIKWLERKHAVKIRLHKEANTEEVVLINVKGPPANVIAAACEIKT